MGDRSRTVPATVLQTGQTARQSKNPGSDLTTIAESVAAAVVRELEQKFDQLHIDPFWVTPEEWESYPPGVKARTVDEDGTITIWYVERGIVLGSNVWYLGADRTEHDAYLLLTGSRYPTNAAGVVPNWRSSLRYRL